MSTHATDPVRYHADSGVVLEEFSFIPHPQYPPVTITRVVSHPFEVGDTVTIGAGQTTYTITEVYQDTIAATSDESGRWYSATGTELAKLTRYAI